MSNANVSCAVSNCVYHAKGNVCAADKIKIDVNYYAEDDRMEFAMDFDERPTSAQASHSMYTCCQTFQSKS